MIPDHGKNSVLDGQTGSFAASARWLDTVTKSRFVRNMSVIMGATAVSQIISFALTPVISRLFEPLDFGMFGSFFAILNVMTACVTLQYSNAIMLPKNDEDAANVFVGSMLSVLLITLASLSVGYLLSEWVLGLLNAPTARWLLWIIPTAIFMTGINMSLQGWCIRRKAFGKTAVSQVVRSGSNGTLQIVTGLLSCGGGGLIASWVAATGIASLNLSRQVLSMDKELLRRTVNWQEIGKQLKEYRDFPIYSATQNVVNALSQGLPILFLGYFYGLSVAGAYAFGERLLKVPMNFILNSLRPVLFQKACETHNRGGTLLDLYLKTTIGLFVIALLPSSVLFIWSPQIFSWLFGSQWHVAGELARWLVLWLVVGFCNLPSVLFARILRKQRSLFLYECVGLAATIAALAGGAYFMTSAHTVILYSVVGSSLNAFLILWIYYSLRRSIARSVNEDWEPEPKASEL